MIEWPADAVAIFSAFVSVIAAFVAFQQARHAKCAAKSAERQAEAAEKQVSLAADKAAIETISLASRAKQQISRCASAAEDLRSAGMRGKGSNDLANKAKNLMDEGNALGYLAPAFESSVMKPLQDYVASLVNISGALGMGKADDCALAANKLAHAHAVEALDELIEKEKKKLGH